MEKSDESIMDTNCVYFLFYKNDRKKTHKRGNNLWENYNEKKRNCHFVHECDTKIDAKIVRRGWKIMITKQKKSYEQTQFDEEIQKIMRKSKNNMMKKKKWNKK